MTLTTDVLRVTVSDKTVRSNIRHNLSRSAERRLRHHSDEPTAQSGQILGWAGSCRAVALGKQIGVTDKKTAQLSAF